MVKVLLLLILGCAALEGCGGTCSDYVSDSDPHGGRCDRSCVGYDSCGCSRRCPCWDVDHYPMKMPPKR